MSFVWNSIDSSRFNKLKNKWISTSFSDYAFTSKIFDVSSCPNSFALSNVLYSLQHSWKSGLCLSCSWANSNSYRFYIIACICSTDDGSRNSKSISSTSMFVISIFLTMKAAAVKYNCLTFSLFAFEYFSMRKCNISNFIVSYYTSFTYLDASIIYWIRIIRFYIAFYTSDSFIILLILSTILLSFNSS